MKSRAKLRYLRQSPRKVRLVADLIRGLDVKVAQNQLRFLNKKATLPVLKLLESAIANAENNFQLQKDNLYIQEIRVDQGPTLGRWMPKAFGRATPIRKKTSHITIILSEKIETIKEDKKDKKDKIKKAKVVSSLDEVIKADKTIEVAESQVDKNLNLAKNKEEDHKGEPVDPSMHGKDRGKQHLDRLRSKGKGGAVKRMFQRKSG